MPATASSTVFPDSSSRAAIINAGSSNIVIRLKSSGGPLGFGELSGRSVSIGSGEATGFGVSVGSGVKLGSAVGISDDADSSVNSVSDDSILSVSVSVTAVASSSAAFIVC